MTVALKYHAEQLPHSRAQKIAMTTSKMQHLDTYCSKAELAAHEEATVVELELSTGSRQLQLGESYH